MTDKHTDFDSFQLEARLLQGIYSYGFERPSSIQSRAIPAIKERRDLIAQAQSGTGKTGAFSIGMLDIIDLEVNECQGIILSPTRELASQTNCVINSIGSFMNVKTHTLVGGTNVRNDKNILKSKVHCVVATPGRLLQMLHERCLNVDQLKLLIIDEADEMLMKGFTEQLYEVFQFIPDAAQIGIFSATMPQETIDISSKFLNNPQHILIKHEEITLEGISQFYIALENEEWKLDTLIDLYSKLSISQVIIFCNTKTKVNYVTNEIKCRDFAVSCIHADLTQEERNSIMKSFRLGETRVLITTDIICRGIDVQGVSFVLNYDLPRNKENYIHRIGRSGRYGRKGVAINLVTTDDMKDIEYLEQYYATEIKEMPDNVENFI